MRESVVKPLPFLRSAVGDYRDEGSLLLFASQWTIAAGSARGLGRLPKISLNRT